FLIRELCREWMGVQSAAERVISGRFQALHLLSKNCLVLVIVLTPLAHGFLTCDDFLLQKRFGDFRTLLRQKVSEILLCLLRIEEIDLRLLPLLLLRGLPLTHLLDIAVSLRKSRAGLLELLLIVLTLARFVLCLALESRDFL